MPRRRRRKPGGIVDIIGAKKKLRQAEFFLGHLEHASGSSGQPNPEHLEFYFSACLTAAKSAYYVLRETGGVMVRRVEKRWLADLPTPERARFGAMMGRRDDDVHYGSTGAEPLPKYAKEDYGELRGSGSGWHPAYYPRPVSAFFGSSRDVEMENPDGTKVRAPVLRGTTGLYLGPEGRRIEATTACREFIGQLRSLLDAAKAGDARV